MDKEKLEKANKIAGQIENAKNELEYWKRGVDYNKYCFEICLDGTIVPVRNFIQFEEMKQMAKEYYSKEIDRLQKEFDEL